MQILVGTGSITPKIGICSKCCWTGKSWGLLLVTLVSDKLLMGAGEAQIQFFVWVYQACRAVTFPEYLYSCLSFSLQSSALHFPSGLSWPAPVILGLLGPSSHASMVQLCPGMAVRGGMSSSSFTLPKLDQRSSTQTLHPWERCSDSEAFTNTSR